MPVTNRQYIFESIKFLMESEDLCRYLKHFNFFFFAENLTVKSLDFSIRLSIFAEKSHRYLCFNNKWSLVGSVSVHSECLYILLLLLTSSYSDTFGRLHLTLRNELFFFTIFNKPIGLCVSPARYIPTHIYKTNFVIEYTRILFFIVYVR